MRILKLHFKNINSLAGEWTIDFTDSAYMSDGLFAITGPTGAGKTTILDAICLALYCRTPRQGAITQNSNELMSRQTGECISEVTFQTKSGLFRARFEQHRSRYKFDQPLQAPNWELANAQSGDVLSSKRTETEAAIIKELGLTYEQFIRAVMLAQGEFKKFLEAKPDERASLLETITGTEIYTEISRKIYERSESERRKLDDFDLRLQGIALLSEEDEKVQQDRLQKIDNRMEILTPEIKSTQEQIQWHQLILKLKSEEDAIQQDVIKNKSELKLFLPERKQLERDAVAQPLQPDWVRTQAAEKALEEKISQIEQTDKKIVFHESQLQTVQSALAGLEQAVVQAAQNREQELPIINQTKDLDVQLNSQNQALKQVQLLFKEKESQLHSACRAAGIQAEEIPADLTTDLIEQEIAAALYNQEEESLQKFIDRQVQFRKKWLELLPFVSDTEKAEKEKKDLEDSIEPAKSALSELQQAHKERGEEIESLRARQDELERLISQSEKILSFEQHRQTLETNSPCPLCGALEHPFCINLPPIEKLESDKQSLKKVKKDLREKDADYKKEEKSLGIKEGEIAQTQKRIEDLTKTITENSATSQAICEKVLACDNTISSREIQFRINCIDLKTGQIQSRLNSAHDYEKKKSIVLLRHDLLDVKTRFNQATQDYNALLQQREKIFGTKKPDDELKRLENAIKTAEEEQTQAKNQEIALNSDLKNQRQNKTALEKERDLRADKYTTELKSFKVKLQNAEFTDTSDFLSAVLPDAQRVQITQRAKRLDDTALRLEERQKGVSEKLDALLKRNLTDKPESFLVEYLNQNQTEYDSNLQEKGQISQRLEENKSRKDSVCKIQAQRTAQKEISDKWSLLNDLIGSADGKKFRKMVQRISLETLIDFANVELNALTRRYTLTLSSQNEPEPEELNAEESNSNSTTASNELNANEEEAQSATEKKKTKGTSRKKPSVRSQTQQALSLFCIDAYQGGEIRPTSNLSGGESFLVSLALALGLSRMSSQNMTLETLFLDEGFGTLDDQTLQTALDALNQFQYSNGVSKLIGVISHVEALKERIANKIEVKFAQSGTSIMSGSGVSS